MISLTATAAAAIRDAQRTRQIDGYGLKLHVVGGGCEGFVYDLAFADAPDKGDQVYESRGIKIFVDPRAGGAVEGLTIDHATGPRGSGFVFENPAARRRCDCGASFSPR